MRILQVLLLLLPTFGFAQQPPVKFHGLYEIVAPNPKPTDYSFYFRFYADGLVIGAQSTPNNIKVLMSAMTYENRRQYSAGFYTYEDGVLIVVINGDASSGSLLYRGKVDPNNNDNIALAVKFYDEGRVISSKPIPYTFKPF